MGFLTSKSPEEKEAARAAKASMKQYSKVHGQIMQLVIIDRGFEVPDPEWIAEVVYPLCDEAARYWLAANPNPSDQRLEQFHKELRRQHETHRDFNIEARRTYLQLADVIVESTVRQRDAQG
jgi:hypothetical protein